MVKVRARARIRVLGLTGQSIRARVLGLGLGLGLDGVEGSSDEQEARRDANDNDKNPLKTAHDRVLVWWCGEPRGLGVVCVCGGEL